jgi:hypothetical protein
MRNMAGGGRKDRSFHEWVNSVGVLLAISVSGFSAYLSWQTSRLKYEDVTSLATLTHSCNAEYQKSNGYGVLGLCWIVTLSNRSENKLSLITGRVYSLYAQGPVSWEMWGFNSVENIDGTPFNFPITLDGGEAKRVLVRAPVQVPPSVAQVLDNLVTKGMSLQQVGFALTQRRLNYLGDPVDVVLDHDGKIVSAQLTPPYKSITSVWEIQTGRGTKFLTSLVYPY